LDRGASRGRTRSASRSRTSRRILLDDYRANGRKSEARARQSFAHVEDFFGRECRALDITADRLTAYRSRRTEAGAFPSTIRNELAALKRAFNLALLAGRLPSKPAFPAMTVDNARSGFFEEEEFRAVAGNLRADLQAVVEFMYYTGWRRGEVQSLQWSQVDLKAGVIRLWTSKNGEGRTLPFHALPALVDLMRRQREATEALERESGRIVPWVFWRRRGLGVAQDGQPIRGFRRAWIAACDRAGLARRVVDARGRALKVIPRRIPHDFRRTAVRNMERAGVSRSVAMKITGHKTESVYRRYAIVSEADLAEGLAKVARLAGRAVPVGATVFPFAEAK
jgi:integrase